MMDSRPPEVEALLVLAVADGGQAIDERVVPDVEDVTGVPGNLHPRARRGAGDGDVLQTRLDDAQCFVALDRGMNGIGMVVVPLQQAVTEGAELEEIVLLF